jgi:outer membrane protein OmpA-like peptidoglycan-associated protein
MASQIGTLAKDRSPSITERDWCARVQELQESTKRFLPKLLATVLFLAAAGSAQVAPYAGAGIGANGLGFQSPYYNADVGIDWGSLHPVFFEAEAGADTANPNGLDNGVTMRAEGIAMVRVTQHWRLGGGFHFTHLFTSKYNEHSTWPTLGAMFERDWFRLNAQYLIPTGTDYTLNGPLFDMRMHMIKRLYFRERVGIYSYRNPDEASPAHHVNAVADFGVLYVFGGEPAGPPASADCTINPGEVMVGEPVSASALGRNFNPKHTLRYDWSSTGGKITGKDNTGKIDTNGVAGGRYTAGVRISDPQMKQGGEASCMAVFSVKEPPKNPPALSCSASPSTVQTGAPSTISCTCTSPDNAPVTVGGWTASGGSVSGSGSTAALDTSGASAGPITVTATCSDTRGLSTQATAQVGVEILPPPPSEFAGLEARLALYSIYFPTDQPGIAKPEGGLLASQQQTLISVAEDFNKYLQTKPGAHLTLEGHADRRGSAEYNQALSERRVERTKRFLIEHGVPAANLETKAFGEQENMDEAQVKDAVERNPQLTPEQRQKVLHNMKAILLASNRRVDITLSTTGQRSAREFPFKAPDSSTLIEREGRNQPDR